MTQSIAISGTPLYMSPEQAQGQVIDQSSDLFSLGSVLYVMCSGRPPFRASTAFAVLKRVVEDQPRPIKDIIPEVPDWLVAIIARLHAKQPADRFASAQEIAYLLARCLAEMQQHGRVNSLDDVIPMPPKPTRSKQEPIENESPKGKEQPVADRNNRSLHHRRWLSAAAMIGMLLLGLGMTEATGVTNIRGTVIRLFSPDGTLVVEVDDPGVSVSINGEEMVITGAGVKEIRLKPGQYKVLASKDGRLVRQELVTVNKNDRQVVRVSREAEPGKIAEVKPAENPQHPIATTDDSRKEPSQARVGADTPPQAVAKNAVDDFVPLLNSKNLDGWMVESGDAKQWKVQSNELLAESTNWMTQTWLLTAKEYADFTLRLEFRLDGIASGAIAVRATPGERQKDTGPIHVPIHPMIKITTLSNEPTGTMHWMNSGARFIRPQQAAELRSGWNQITVEVQGERLQCTVNDKVIVDSKLSNSDIPGWISPGLGRRAGSIGLQVHSGKIGFRNIEVKELLPATIQSAGPRPPLKPIPPALVESSFVGGHQANWVTEEWLRAVAVLPVEQQLEAVRATLQERNLDFDGVVKHQISNGVVTAIELNVDAVHDLSPLLAFPGLQTLDCRCSDRWSSVLGDLSPLTRLPLRSLRYPYHTWLGTPPLWSIKSLESVNDLPIERFREKALADAEDFARFAKMIATLGPEAQQKAIENRLKELNPRFDGKVIGKVENDVLVDLTANSTNIADISPVRALPGLRTLILSSWKGDATALRDLLPLSGLKLTTLELDGCAQIRDLTPLIGMPLKSLKINACGRIRDLKPLKDMRELSKLDIYACHRIRDLTPLQDTRLTWLIARGCDIRDLNALAGKQITDLDIRDCHRISDLTPLKGMPLTYLAMTANGPLADLGPLQGLRLTSLRIWGGTCQDLTPLREMPLNHLDLSACSQVRDLTPLKGLPLQGIDLKGTAVRDLSPLEGMSLEYIDANFQNITKGLDVLRSMKTLKRIGNEGRTLPPAEFWKQYEGVR